MGTRYVSAPSICPEQADLKAIGRCATNDYDDLVFEDDASAGPPSSFAGPRQDLAEPALTGYGEVSLPGTMSAA
jgi:hypothetical protein